MLLPSRHRSNAQHYKLNNCRALSRKIWASCSADRSRLRMLLIISFGSTQRWSLEYSMRSAPTKSMPHRRQGVDRVEIEPAQVVTGPVLKIQFDPLQYRHLVIDSTDQIRQRAADMWTYQLQLRVLIEDARQNDPGQGDRGIEHQPVEGAHSIRLAGHASMPTTDAEFMENPASIRLLPTNCLGSHEVISKEWVQVASRTVTNLPWVTKSSDLRRNAGSNELQTVIDFDTHGFLAECFSHVGSEFSD